MYYNNFSMPQRTDIVRVTGENGARAYNMAPGSSALLLDETAPIVWLKTTDGAGYPSLTAYDIKPHEVEQPADIKALAERITKLEERLNEQPDTANDRKQSSRASGSN